MRSGALLNIRKALMFAIAIICISVLAGGCDSIKGITDDQPQKVQEAYIEYFKAVQAENVEALKRLVAREKAKELQGPEAATMLGMIKAFYPAQSRITAVNINGDAATIKLTGRSQDGTVHGTVNLIKEDGLWKISKEDWQVKISMPEEKPASAPIPDTSKPFEYHKVVGAWKGHEAGQSSDEWDFSFGENYEVSVRNSTGKGYRGIAMSDWNLGLSGGSLRVLRGGAVFDVKITEAPNKAYEGKISLGSFKLMGDVLQLCGSEPGLMKRTSDFASADGIRCFELKRSQP
ncbi:MAG: DUF4878 domain-containing protein [Nitrospirae bacterium]|nr:DUF4878 domain-containing protein [Nitrospirota bacterium]